MNIAFHGAARTVTGSKHLISHENGKKYLLDCGMFQGMGRETDGLNKEWGFDPAEVSVLVLSHAHIDHCGLIPKLVKDGFRGPIFCTPATKALTAILLEDSAFIQEDDAKFENKRRIAQGNQPVRPLYEKEDVQRTLPLFQSIDYGAWFTIDEDVQLMFTDAGHIIGSAAVHLQIKEGSRTTHLSFSGDVGRYNDMLLKSPQVFPQADYILLESTYGNKLHDLELTTPDMLLKWILDTCIHKKGKLVIPAFSVGRTQELLYALNHLELDGKLPPVDYFVDSPMSIEVTEMVKRFPENFNAVIQEVLKHDKDPFQFTGLHYVKTVNESKLLNFRNEPCVIISASGMADSGRVKHHISHTIESTKNTILMVGYADSNSLAGKLLNGAKEVKIFGIDHEVHAEVGSIRSMSAHGDYKDLLEFVNGQDRSIVRKVFLVHGEIDTQEKFRERLMDKGFKDVEIPERHSVWEL
ncbi:MAG: MBL fold metallo-hydrolase [Chitinophagaceae bacterium]